MPENDTNPVERDLVLDSNVAELERLKTFVDTFCQVESVADEMCGQLQVVLEELVLNIITYGGCEPTGSAIRLSMERINDEVHAVLSDTGIRFNPLEMPPPDIATDVLERPLGGLGIHIVRHLVQSIRYERLENRNYLYLIKRINSDPHTVAPEGDKNANRNGDHQN